VQESLHAFLNITKTVSKVEDSWEKTQFDSNKIKICLWNVNGIRAVINKGSLATFLENENPDIVCFNETKIDDLKIKSEKVEQKIPSEYLKYWNCSKPPKLGYSGTAIFTKVKPLKVQRDFGSSKHNNEGRCITAEFEKFYLVCVYVPNAQFVSSEEGSRFLYRVNEWDTDLREYVCKLKKEGKPVILVGDMNVAHNDIDVWDPVSFAGGTCFTLEERGNLSKLIVAGFVDTFRKLYPSKVKYSFFNVMTKQRQHGRGWRLDYMLVSEDISEAVVDSDILDAYYGSDHLPIKLELDLDKIGTKCIEKPNESLEKMTADLELQKKEEAIKDEKDHNVILAPDTTKIN